MKLVYEYYYILEYSSVLTRLMMYIILCATRTNYNATL